MYRREYRTLFHLTTSWGLCDHTEQAPTQRGET